MKVITRIMLLIALNIFLFAFLCTLGTFMRILQSAIVTIDKSDYAQLFLPFTCLQIGINIWLYVKGRFRLPLYSLLINIAVVLALYWYLFIHIFPIML
ncbi:hypothetical protein [Chitinophaga varians]|uniref:hypothetical protein n=1 Tax=Chitinophaga varians TaxID=2202339 RepID=UPI00165F8651|nr:hypothetical protein [Chitinophaga varians]MBC9911294.1 hypothetical protein [Chitinophaga varians]